MVHLSESKGVGAAYAGVGLHVECGVVFGQRVVVEDHIGEQLGGVVTVGVEAVVGREGAGVVAVHTGDAQVPRVVEIVAKGEGAVPGEGVKALAVCKVRVLVLCRGIGRAGLEREVPAVAVLERGIAVGERTG